MPWPSLAGRALAVASAVALLCAAAPAAAAPVSIVSDPLSIHVDERGQLQAVRAGESGGMFFPPASTTGDAGFFLAFPADAAPPPSVAGLVFGFQGGAGPSGLQEYALGAQGAVAGIGTPADPLHQQTSYAVPGVAEVVQTTSYVPGEQAFTVRWEVRNLTAAQLPFKALAAADFNFDGGDTGTGVFTDGPPRFVGGTSAATGRSGGFAEAPPPATPWSHYEALAFGPDPASVWGKVQSAAQNGGPTFADAVLGTPADNAGGVEWDGYLANPLPAGATAGFELIVVSAVPAALQLTPPTAQGTQGAPVTFAATARDRAGAPVPGVTVRYTIVGANPGAGQAVTDAAGTAAIVDDGAHAGTDTVVAFLDLNGTGAREATEPQASAVAAFADRSRPRCSARIRRARRVGGGGRGVPLLVAVRCGEPVAVRARAALALPRLRGARRRTVRLETVGATLRPGRAAPIRIRVPRAVRRGYAGRRVTATVRVTARDAAGNATRYTARRQLRLAALRARR